MRILPFTLAQLNALVASMHRHHKPVQGHRFSLGLEHKGKLIGGCSVGRPVARNIDQFGVAEVTRLVTDGTKNACSMLYSAAARACQAMGFDRIQTYILESEPGTSLKASGWSFDRICGGGSWVRETRKRREDQPMEKKQRWIKVFREPDPMSDPCF